MHRSRTLTTIAAGMLALIPLAAGCSGDDRDPAEPDLAPASTSASTTTETTSATPSTTESTSGTASSTRSQPARSCRSVVAERLPAIVAAAN